MFFLLFDKTPHFKLQTKSSRNFYQFESILNENVRNILVVCEIWSKTILFE